eukprot:COSAG01_NODE_14987_length_1388_cov_1.442203_1_plen_191_part_00
MPRGERRRWAPALHGCSPPPQTPPPHRPPQMLGAAPSRRSPAGAGARAALPSRGVAVARPPSCAQHLHYPRCPAPPAAPPLPPPGPLSRVWRASHVSPARHHRHQLVISPRGRRQAHAEARSTRHGRRCRRRAVQRVLRQRRLSSGYLQDVQQQQPPSQQQRRQRRQKKKAAFLHKPKAGGESGRRRHVR